MTDKPNNQFNKNAAQLTRLAAAQIRVAVSESGEDVNTLSTSFREIVRQDKLIRNTIEQLPDDPVNTKIKDDIAILSSQLRSSIDNAVIAFQFYDRLCQRLDHTSECLRSLSEIENQNLQTNADEVTSLRDDLYKHFTMIEERQLFDAVLSNKEFEQAIEEYSIARLNSLKDDSEDNDIEFFD